LGRSGVRRQILIALLAGDDALNAATGFLNIPLVAGDELNVGMGHGLACGGVDVDPYIEPFGVELLLEDGFDLVQQDEAVRLLLEGQINISGNMPDGDHQGVTLTNRELIKNCIDCCGFSNYRSIGWGCTEGAECRLVHARWFTGSMAVGWSPKLPTLRPPEPRSGSRSCSGATGYRCPATIQKVSCPSRRFEILFGSNFVDFGTKYPSTGESGFLLGDQIGRGDFVSFLVVHLGIRRGHIP
jgi:hypothetical protein